MQHHSTVKCVSVSVNDHVPSYTYELNLRQGFACVGQLLHCWLLVLLQRPGNTEIVLSNKNPRGNNERSLEIGSGRLV